MDANAIGNNTRDFCRVRYKNFVPPDSGEQPRLCVLLLADCGFLDKYS